MKQETFFDSLHGLAVLPFVKRTCSTCLFLGKKDKTPQSFCLISLKAVNAAVDRCEDYEALKR